MQPNQTINPLKIKSTYVAVLTQSGTNPPVATVLQNTYEGTITWDYETTGSYFANINTEEFVKTKTICNIGQDWALTINTAFPSGSDNNQVNITTQKQNETTQAFARINDRLYNTPITITTYY